MTSWTERTTEADRVRVFHGDSREVLKAFPDAHFDSVVCDPPYALVSIVKRFGADGAAPAQVGASGAYARASAGFMGQTWDTGETAFAVEFWAEVYRVLKPGGHVAAFGGTRSAHRLAVAIEDAGFEIRDCCGWVFGSGFPKSHNVSKQLRAYYGVDALCEGGPRCSQTGEGSPVDCRPADGSDGERLPPLSDTGPASPPSQADAPTHSPSGSPQDGQGEAASHSRSTSSARPSSGGSRRQASRPSVDSPASDSALSDTPSNKSNDGSKVGRKKAPDKRDRSRSDDGSAASSSADPFDGNGNLSRCAGCGKIVVQDGLGTALKPAWEMIYIARKPLAGTVAANVLAHGTGALNIDSSRIGTTVETWPKTRNYAVSERQPGGSGVTVQTGPAPAGRWPANVIHDGSEEVVGAFPETAISSGGGGLKTSAGLPDSRAAGAFYDGPVGFGDSGSAARFFYSAKADAEDRLGSRHPTVKPVDLMAYLVRLVTPPGGLTLDPFAGSGTTGVGAMREGMRCVLIEREEAYVEDIIRKLAWARGEGRLTALEVARLDKPENQAKAAGADLPLFS